MNSETKVEIEKNNIKPLESLWSLDIRKSIIKIPIMDGECKIIHIIEILHEKV